jgi:hypothetical protein
MQPGHGAYNKKVGMDDGSSYAFVVEQAANHFICTNVGQTYSLVCV